MRVFCDRTQVVLFDRVNVHSVFCAYRVRPGCGASREAFEILRQCLTVVSLRLKRRDVFVGCAVDNEGQDLLSRPESASLASDDSAEAGRRRASIDRGAIG
jgi:hypothetical protein